MLRPLARLATLALCSVGATDVVPNSISTAAAASSRGAFQPPASVASAEASEHAISDRETKFHASQNVVVDAASSSWQLHCAKALAVTTIILSAVAGIGLRFRCPAFKSPSLLAYVRVFAGGMFVSMGMFHILPEVLAHQPKSMATLFTKDTSALPVMVFAFLGFSTVLLFDRVLFDAHGGGSEPVDEEAFKDFINPRRSFIKRTTSSISSFSNVAEAGKRPSLSEAVQSQSPSTRIVMETELSSQSKKDHSSHRHGLDQGRGHGHGAEVGRGHGHGTESVCCSHGHRPEEGHGHGHGHGAEVGHGHGHGHAHGVGTGTGSGAIILMIALSVHSCFEGIVIGTAEDVSTVWLACLIVALHKWAEAFAIASELTPAQRATKLAFYLLSIFTMASPLGMVLGWAVQSSAQGNSTCEFIETLLNAVAFGTLLYVGMVEVVAEEFTGAKNALNKFGVFIMAASLVFALTIFHMQGHDHSGHDHGHGHGRGHGHGHGGDHGHAH